MKSSGFFSLPLALLSIGSEACPIGLNQTEHGSFRACNTTLFPEHAPWAMKSTCPGPDGKPMKTGFVFGRCLLNINGVLRGGHSNALTWKIFLQTCNWHEGSLVGSVYNCRCKDDNGQWVDNSIDLEGIITPQNGRLHCFNHYGKIDPEADPEGALRERKEEEKDPLLEYYARDIFAELSAKDKDVEMGEEKA
ncbi:hypothetical protein C2857_004218 [Epichloe festucae Fl1]|uniref:Cyanovirin-N domain-containing protein n=1 Tax=Epichloe festucae (strain Fl1) TaxID=877507 RepID=A0A7S9PTP6_EPIFF|nr:hypothetical protein C2857_004218 [Epichloe festucae Fl1]